MKIFRYALLIGLSQNRLQKFAGPGHRNDPDMIEAGNGGMNRGMTLETKECS